MADTSILCKRASFGVGMTHGVYVTFLFKAVTQVTQLFTIDGEDVLQCVVVCCSVLQCVAVQ